jgi:hypothetical protein
MVTNPTNIYRTSQVAATAPQMEQPKNPDTQSQEKSTQTTKAATSQELASSNIPSYPTNTMIFIFVPQDKKDDPETKKLKDQVRNTLKNDKLGFTLTDKNILEVNFDPAQEKNQKFVSAEDNLKVGISVQDEDIVKATSEAQLLNSAEFKELFKSAKPELKAEAFKAKVISQVNKLSQARQQAEAENKKSEKPAKEKKGIIGKLLGFGAAAAMLPIKAIRAPFNKLFNKGDKKAEADDNTVKQENVQEVKVPVTEKKVETPKPKKPEVARKVQGGDKESRSFDDDYGSDGGSKAVTGRSSGTSNRESRSDQDKINPKILLNLVQKNPYIAVLERGTNATDQLTKLYEKLEKEPSSPNNVTETNRPESIASTEITANNEPKSESPVTNSESEAERDDEQANKEANS